MLLTSSHPQRRCSTCHTRSTRWWWATPSTRSCTRWVLAAAGGQASQPVGLDGRSGRSPSAGLPPPNSLAACRAQGQAQEAQLIPLPSPPPADAQVLVLLAAQLPGRRGLHLWIVSATAGPGPAPHVLPRVAPRSAAQGLLCKTLAEATAGRQHASAASAKTRPVSRVPCPLLPAPAAS